jgi:hypothetical protein
MARQSHLTYRDQDRVILDVLDDGDRALENEVRQGIGRVLGE